MSPLLRLLAAGAVALSAAAAAASAVGAGRPFTAADLIGLDRASDPHVSPDGKTVAFTLRATDLDKNRGVTSIWTLDLGMPGAQPQKLELGAGGGASPRWSPDGRTLYFASGRSGTSQVWKVDAAALASPAVTRRRLPGGVTETSVSLAGAPRQVTRLPLDVGAFRVSPDGRRLVVSMAVFPGAEDPAATKARMDVVAADKSSGVVYDKLFVRHWDAWADGTRNHLFAVDLGGDGATATPLTPGFDGDAPSRPFGDDVEFSFSPDGATVFFSARVAGRGEALSTNFDIYSVPAAGGAAPRNLTAANKAWDAGPVVSPDGTRLAYRAMKRAGFEADRYGVMVMDLKSGATREIDVAWDRSAETLKWSADGRTLYLTAGDVGTERLYAMDAATGRATPLTTGGHVTEYDLAGGDLVFLRDSMASPAQLFRVGARGGEAAQLSRFDADRLAGVEMAAYEPFSFPGWNGETVHGYVVKPSGYVAGRKYPTAFLIHGGPQGSFGDSWSYRWNPQFYAGLGYAVVMVDFHGSTGYGQGFTDAISGHWGDRPLEDLQKGWAAAQARYPFIDGSRACALGASYGGFMVDWIAGSWAQPWKCLVSHDGVFDDRSMGYATEELWFSTWEHGGPDHTPFRDPASYERFNPVTRVKDWSRPILFIHGGRDFRIPVEQGLAAFSAAQLKGVESKFLYFPDENHWVLKPANSLRWHATVADWLKTHLEAGA